MKIVTRKTNFVALVKKQNLIRHRKIITAAMQKAKSVNLKFNQTTSHNRFAAYSTPTGNTNTIHHRKINEKFYHKTVQGLSKGIEAFEMSHSEETQSTSAVSCGVSSFVKNANDSCCYLNQKQFEDGICYMTEKMFWDSMSPLEFVEKPLKTVDNRFKSFAFFGKSCCLSNAEIEHISDIRCCVINELRKRNPNANVKWFSSQLMCKVIGKVLGISNCDNICSFQPFLANQRVKVLNLGVVWANQKHQFMKHNLCLF